MGRGFSRGFNRGFLHAALANLLALEARDVAAFSIVTSDETELNATEAPDQLAATIQARDLATLDATEARDIAAFHVEGQPNVVPASAGSSIGGLVRPIAPVGKVRRKRTYAGLFAVEPLDLAVMRAGTRDLARARVVEAADTFAGGAAAAFRSRVRVVATEAQDTFKGEALPFDVEDNNRALLFALAA